MADNKPHIIQPPKRLGDKVPRTGGPSAIEAIGKALKLADDLMDKYQGWAVDDLQNLWQAFNQTKKSRRNRAAEQANVRQMFNVAHEIRGQGGSFGYPLITLLSDSLCKFLEPRGTLSDRELEIVRIHILALKAVFSQHLKGTQEGLSGELKPLLMTLRDKA